jgi:hypothetical protein
MLISTAACKGLWVRCTIGHVMQVKIKHCTKGIRGGHVCDNGQDGNRLQLYIGMYPRCVSSKDCVGGVHELGCQCRSICACICE